MSRTRKPPSIARHVAVYGGLLALAVFGLQWLDYQRVARMHWNEVYVGLIALAFLALGVFVGARLFAGTARPLATDGNPAALGALGISERELGVLRELVAGRSNKEIAATLHIAPSTVKTHVASLYAKLEVRRRTEAARRARELGIL